MLTVENQPDFFARRFPKTRASLTGGVVQTLKKVEKRALALPKWIIVLLNIFLSFLIACSMIIFAILIIPEVYYLFFPADIIKLEPAAVASLYGGEYSTDQTLKNKSVFTYIPEYDETLPDGNWISIPLIGVRTELRDTVDSKEALEQGVWWVPDFGKPGDDSGLPMIVAAHRFGWKWWWRDNYWKYHSFYLLPETEVGDRVEVIVDHRKSEYEIYAGEEGDEITDYNADLILYTCKYLQSPIRYFRYARLIDPTQNTQR